MGWRIHALNTLLPLSSCRLTPSLPLLQTLALSTGPHNSAPGDPQVPPPRHAHGPDLPRRVSVVASADRPDMESQLDLLSLRPSRDLVLDVVRLLARRGRSALRFFIWASSPPHRCPMDPEVYDAVVSNLFSLGDYDAAVRLLKELAPLGYSPSAEAFGFLRHDLSVSGSGSRRETVAAVVTALKRVGDPCSRPAVEALIRVLCELRMFDLAAFAMEETPRRISYFHALMAGKCRSGDFRGAKVLLDEMRRSDCEPSTSTYNYMLGSLFKNGRVAEGCGLLQVMEESGCAPNGVTYEVVVFRACRIGNMDVALGFVDKMLSEGLRPRLTTHAAVIKGLFRLGKVADAHKYVVDMCVRDSCSANTNYSLQANLLRMSGRVVEAAEILNEMMEKGLKPNFPVYKKVVKDSRRIGREDLVSNLTCKFLMFPLPTH